MSRPLKINIRPAAASGDIGQLSFGHIALQHLRDPDLPGSHWPRVHELEGPGA